MYENRPVFTEHVLNCLYQRIKNNSGTLNNDYTALEIA